jgi:uncharacterized protein (DUF433 family)
MHERIAINPKVCHGQACVKGTRMPVHQVVRMLANGDSVEDLLAEYPFLSREDIMASLDYAAGLAEEQITPIEVANL